jgi:hypothetical protein
VSYKYAPIWKTIKASPSGEAEVTVHKDVAETVIQGLKRTKSAENVTRSKVGLIPWSKLVIEKEILSDRTGMMKIKFKLFCDTRL